MRVKRAETGTTKALRGPGVRAVMRLMFLVALLLGSNVPRVEAGVNVWSSSGPEGGPINTLAIDPRTPSTFYAGTNGGGVFKSTNDGGSWS